MQTLQELKDKLNLYENDGISVLYHALNRKMNECANMLNKHNLANLDISDPKDKTFERLKSIWESAASLSSSAKMLKDIPDVDKKVDTAKDETNAPPIGGITTPEKIADVYGNN